MPFKVEEDYTVIKVVGEGQFGQVKEVQQNRSGKRFAWKRAMLEKDPYCEREMELLQNLEHEHIVQMYDAHFEAEVVDMILELCHKGTMWDYLQSRMQPSPITGRRGYMRPELFDIAVALKQVRLVQLFVVFELYSLFGVNPKPGDRTLHNLISWCFHCSKKCYLVKPWGFAGVALSPWKSGGA